MALSSHRVVFVVYAFLGDTNLIQMAKFPNNDFEEVLLQTQWALDMWNGIILATGGALVPEKQNILVHNRVLMVE